jgi:3-hydroxybutyrate dehydrogenase
LVAKQIEARAQEQGMTLEDAKVDLLQEKQPSKDFVTPEQIGALACFLCSDSAAQMTGAALNIDGGWLAQ